MFILYITICTGTLLIWNNLVWIFDGSYKMFKILHLVKISVLYLTWTHCVYYYLLLFYVYVHIEKQ